MIQSVSQSVQLLSHVSLSVTPWIAAHQASLSITNSGVYSDSCPSSRWCHPTSSPSVIPFSSRPYVGDLIFCASAFSKTSLYIWKFSVHVLLKTSLKYFEHCLGNMWNGCNFMVDWTFFGIGFLWDWNETDLFNPVTTAEFSKFAGIWVQHFHSIICCRSLHSLARILLPPLALFTLMLPKAPVTLHCRISSSRWVTI